MDKKVSVVRKILDCKSLSDEGKILFIQQYLLNWQSEDEVLKTIEMLEK